jgi:hypothetical protein
VHDLIIDKDRAGWATAPAGRACAGLGIIFKPQDIRQVLPGEWLGSARQRES